MIFIMVISTNTNVEDGIEKPNSNEEVKKQSKARNMKIWKQ